MPRVTQHKDGSVTIHLRSYEAINLKNHLKADRLLRAYKPSTPEEYQVLLTAEQQFMVQMIQRQRSSPHHSHPLGAGWLFKVPNSEVGRRFLRFFRQIMNNGGWELRIRGRTPKRGRSSGFYGTRVRDAKILAVYIERRKAP